MNVFYEEDGSFKVASIMTENPGSLQVEAPGGKRSKIKSANVLMRFDGALTGFMENVQQESQSLDASFLWECCGEPEFGFENLAREYYGTRPSPEQSAAVALCLHGSPMYFYRKGKGRYKAAPEDNLRAALASQEKKRLQAERVTRYIEQLKSHQLPPEFADKLDMLLYEPDKNTLEWKALEQATAESQTSRLKLLETCGAIPSPHDYHLGAFLREYFPAGIQFGEHEAVEIPDNLEKAEVSAFSIDDSTTTEIDDALSVQQLPDGFRIGIHIAAPALGVKPGSQLDMIAMKRLSTVYMPGNKITMLPEAAIQPFSLTEGQWKPALSLYLDISPDLSVRHRHSKVELVNVVDNLRHDELEPHFNANTLETPCAHPYWQQLALLHRLAESLEKARGKYDPSKPPQVDYNFYVEDGRVRIVSRHRGSPMDKVVSELMIEANSQWGALLHEHGVPGIYRAQNNGKVYMTVKAEPHQGLGVSQYTWCTSPLRRMVDLINQRQIMAILQNDPLPYPKGSETLTTAMREFDLAYNAYHEFQSRMERYWCLKYIQQEGLSEIGGTVIRDNLVRLDGMPYITKVPSLPEPAVGARVQLEVRNMDFLEIQLDARFKAVIVDDASSSARTAAA